MANDDVGLVMTVGMLNISVLVTTSLPADYILLRYSLCLLYVAQGGNWGSTETKGEATEKTNQRWN